MGDLAGRLPTLFDRLLRREAARLPVEIPEVPEISAYWAGKVAEPPLLTVAFSGLGRQSAGWVRELGDLSAVIRAAARGRMGLTALATGRRTDRGDSDPGFAGRRRIGPPPPGDDRLERARDRRRSAALQVST